MERRQTLLLALIIGVAVVAGIAADAPLAAEEAVAAAEVGVLKSIQTDNGIPHLVPIDEIISGGPPKDGIPAIDAPKFVTVKNASEFLADTEKGLAVEAGGEARFYPFSILVWHEIVNDKLGKQDVLVSYCPLCGSGMVFDPKVESKPATFGVSGRLWNSNLLMYDRATETFWSQILGQAVYGTKTGEKLTLLASDQTTFGDWKSLHPKGQVLSPETGVDRPYGRDPYLGYEQVGAINFPVNNHDHRLHYKKPILGVQVGDSYAAVLPEAVKKAARLEKKIGEKTIVMKWDEKANVPRLFEKDADGKMIRYAPVHSYWFCWIAVHPESELIQ
jgi:Protein of unknown function (DUF3179)